MSHFSYNRPGYGREGEEPYEKPARIRTTGTSTFRRRMMGLDEPSERPERRTSAAANPPTNTGSPAYRPARSFEELAVSRSKPIRWRERNAERDALVTRLISPPSSSASSEVAEPSPVTSLPPSSPPWNAEMPLTSENISRSYITRSTEPQRSKGREISPPASPTLPPMRPESPDSPDSQYYSSPSDRSSLRTPAFAEFVRVMTAHTPKHILERPPMDFDIKPFQEAGWFPKGHRYCPKTPPKDEHRAEGTLDANNNLTSELEQPDALAESVEHQIEGSPTPSKQPRKFEELNVFETKNIRHPVDDAITSPDLIRNRYKSKQPEVLPAKNTKENMKPTADNATTATTSKSSLEKHYKSRRPDLIVPKNTEDAAKRSRAANPSTAPIDNVSNTQRPDILTTKNVEHLNKGHLDASNSNKPSKSAPKGKEPIAFTSATVTGKNHNKEELIDTIKSSNHVRKNEHFETFEEFVERATSSASSEEIEEIDRRVTLSDNASNTATEQNHSSKVQQKQQVFGPSNATQQSYQTNYLEAMDVRLNLGLSHIKDAKRGMDQLNRAIEVLPDHLTAKNITPLPQESDCVSLRIALPRLWSRDPTKTLGITFTWIGLILAIFLVWFLTETVACEIFCHPTTSISPYWSRDDPFFPWAIPTKLDQWTGKIMSSILLSLGRVFSAAWKAGRKNDRKLGKRVVLCG